MYPMHRGRTQKHLNAKRYVTPLFLQLVSNSSIKGTMMFPLAGAENEEDFEKSTVFTGDFSNRRTRAEMFALPRRYSFSIVLVPKSGNKYDVDIGEYDLPDDGGVTQEELVLLIKKYAHEQLYEHEPSFFDLTKSAVIIQLYHTKEELPYEYIIRQLCADDS